MTKEELGRRSRARRIERGLKQWELAEDIGSSQGQISAYEQGNHYPWIDILFRIAAALDTTVSELCREVEE